MQLNAKSYKRKLDRELRHVKLILAQLRPDLTAGDWVRLVGETKEAILTWPQEFLCSELPPERVFAEALERVFEGFVEDQRLLAGQTSNPLNRTELITKIFGAGPEKLNLP